MALKRKDITRRKFLLDAGCAALGTSTLFSTMINMKAISAAALDKNPGPKSGDDYKALVCILLAGGIDSHNILIPRGDQEHAEYLTTRSNLAIPKNSILPLNHGGQGGRSYGIHPGMPEVQELFNQGNAAFVANVGTLIQPTTKEEYESDAHPLPLGLYSHSDQIMHWQTGRPGERSNHGWGGRMADLIQSMNANQNISMNFSLSGRNQFQSGQQTIDFSIKPNGNVGIEGFDSDNTYNVMRNAAINSMLEAEYQDLFEQTYVNTLKGSAEGTVQFQEAIENVPEFATEFSETRLSDQMKMVAKVIASREELGFTRQTFFVLFGGWDHHDGVLEKQEEQLPVLSAALGEFMGALEEINATDKVTTFTISDFGRTLTSNGNGSDHAWGGNALVVGGGLNGGEIYGEYPSLELEGPLMLRRGRLIPSVSAAEYMAELAMWFGVSPTDVNDILPDLPNFFDTQSGGYPLGFLNPTV